MRSHLLRLAWLTLIACGCDSAEVPTPSDQKGFVTHTHRDATGHESKFVVFVPASYDPQQPCPVILFLHGAGQIGRDGQAPVRGGLGDAIRNRQSTFPFITIFPQSANGSWEADTSDGKQAIEILKSVQKLYNVDSHRIYLTGYSMGGEGTWSLAAAYPHLFAAIVPICPGSNLEVAAKLKNTPCWCFQGDADDPSRVTNTRKMHLAIRKAGGEPSYQEFPGIEHNCWDLTYQNNDVFDWLLQHQTK